jgi:starch synthase (maltosyl-transferring)
MLICYSKSAGDDVVLVVVNNDPSHTQSGWVHLDASVIDVEVGQQFAVIDLLTKRRYMWSGSSNYVELDPTGIPAHIFTMKRSAPARTEESFDYYS